MSEPKIATADSDDQLDALCASFETYLEDLVAQNAGAPASLMAAASHALRGPSKRIRPLMLHLVAADTAPDPEALRAGAAVELVHTASLILDDLPCMDDAETRRTRPATHRAFGEATAILTAIAMLNRAFGLLGESTIAPEKRIELIALLERAVGWQGLVAGQELDVAGVVADPEGLKHVNWLKTGTLFVAAIAMGGVLRGVDKQQAEQLTRFATEMGLAFQLADDLQDRVGTATQLGKDVGKDRDKTNVVSLLGLEETRDTCLAHLKRADAALVASGIDPTAIRLVVSRALKLPKLGGQ
ncbi:polyprenyl synthetase family protein [Devosia sp.]|uniref:polyprenyl synthetase family protein n=1 Tax=Devosia sp. TaxID=1871048 RepID=UPI003A8F51B6